MDNTRQWGTSKGDIRRDHVERYELAGKLLRGRVLDAACGCGYGSFILHEHGLNVVGVDIEQEAIDWAKKYFPGPQYICGDVENEPWFGGFDGIAAFEMIEHMEQPRSILQIFRMCLRGKLLISTPNQEHYPFVKEKFARDKYPHFRHHTPLEFDSLLENAGFEVEQRYCQDKQGDIKEGTEGRFLVYVCS